MEKSEESLCDLKDSIKTPNIRKIRVPEGEERDMGQKIYLKK